MVMEVRMTGMGARLDAAVMIPDGAVVSALASINFNHQEFLGDTVTGLLRREESRSYRRDRNSPRLRRPVLEYLGLFGPLSSPLNSPRKISVTLRSISHSALFPCYCPAENSPSMFTLTVKSGSGRDNRLRAAYSPFVFISQGER